MAGYAEQFAVLRLFWWPAIPGMKQYRPASSRNGCIQVRQLLRPMADLRHVAQSSLMLMLVLINALRIYRQAVKEVNGSAAASSCLPDYPDRRAIRQTLGILGLAELGRRFGPKLAEAFSVCGCSGSLPGSRSGFAPELAELLPAR